MDPAILNAGGADATPAQNLPGLRDEPGGAGMLVTGGAGGRWQLRKEKPMTNLAKGGAVLAALGLFFVLGIDKAECG